MNYEGKQVLVLGLGESGLAMAHWLARCGAQLVVADTRAEPPNLPALLEAVPSARFVAGAFSAALLEGIDFVAVSPGLSPALELAEIGPAARDKSVPLWSEIELFAQALQQLGSERQYQPKVIAITGTNGKTTVTRLTGLLCQRAGLTVQMAGNISPAALDVLRAALDNDQLPAVWVLELSSFQLHFTFSLQADVATVLNVSQDHLDWHGDMASYVADKARIFGAGTVRLLNRDDPYSIEMATPLANVISFGANAPDESGCFGLMNENGMQWLTLAFSEDDVPPALDGQARQPDKRRRKKDVEAAPLLLKRLMPADALKIRGQHNALNALAALALCRSIGLPLAPLLHGLRDYHGEPHRVELVATVADVQYYDDSKGTNVGATVAALKGMGAEIANDGRRLLLIAGGDGKGQDFSPLLSPVARYVRAVLLIGRDAPAISSALTDANVPLHDCATLEIAVQQAADLAEAGDVVLMSPACASFDMFRNYLHRAQTFIDAVRELGLARGEVSA